MTLQLISRARWALALMALAVLSLPAQAARTIEAGPATLAQAAAQAEPGDVIVLDPGIYGDLHLRIEGARAQPITLRARDMLNRPVFRGLDIRGGRDLKLDGLIFRLRPDRETKSRNMVISDAFDITISRSLFDGLERLDRDGNLRPWGIGLSIRNSSDIALFDSELRGFERGLVVNDVDRITISRNDIHGMRVDGMNFSQVSDVLIEGNTIRDFYGNQTAGDHRDMIQFWTRGTKRPSAGITIRRNVLNSGHGPFTQSIFMRNELVDTRFAGEEMYYQDVIIEENVILNAHIHGITVGATKGLTVQRNTIVRNAVSEGPVDDPGRWTPRIAIDEGSHDVIVLGNVTHGLPDRGWQPNWIIAGNQIVQDTIPGKPDHYDQTFFSVAPTSPAQVSDFAARPGGLLDGRDVGAPQLVAMSELVARTAPEVLPTPGARDMQGVIRLDPDRRLILADGGAGAEPLAMTLPDTSLFIGSYFAPVVLPVEMTGPLFDTEDFVIDMRVRSEGGYRSAGEVLRLHESLRVEITGRGVVEVEVFSDAGRVARVSSKPTRIFHEGLVDIRIAYDGPDGEVVISINGERSAARRLSGRMRPEAYWGLSFGNPFGTRDSFEGVIERFEVRTGPGAVSGLSAINDTAFRE